MGMGMMTASLAMKNKSQEGSTHSPNQDVHKWQPQALMLLHRRCGSTQMATQSCLAVLAQLGRSRWWAKESQQRRKICHH
eukprot:5673775-Karenia_brevis.AAC.1